MTRPSSPPLDPGQIVEGSLFNEPMRVETIRPAGLDRWVVGLVGVHSELAQVMKKGVTITPPVAVPTGVESPTPSPVAPSPPPGTEPGTAPAATTRTLQIRGQIPLELWNRLGTRILLKLRAGTDVKIGIDLSVTATKDQASNLEKDIRQSLDDLGLGGSVSLE